MLDDLNYTLEMSIEYNGTYYNETVDVTIPNNGTATVFINYTANTLPLGVANVSLYMYWSDGMVYMDSWNGTTSIVSGTQYQVGVVLVSMIMNLMTIVIVVLIIAFVFKTIAGTIGGKETTKKGKK